MSDITLGMINDFFKVSKPVPKAQIVAQVKGPPTQTVDSIEPEFKLVKKPHELSSPPPVPGFEYYNGFDEVGSQGAGAVQDVAGLNELELDSPEESTLSEPTAAPFQEEEAAHIYENYDFDHEYDKALPITRFREEIIDTIESNSATIIQGATGSGKTTQVPQYIVDNYAQQKRYCNVVVTQPRRIAAISIAKRVCHERSWSLGSLVGYQVARDRCVSEDTRLSYVTTGVLLQKLIAVKNMNQYTHVIIDEVHERDQETDFCLLVVRKMLRTNSRHVKVVLMSATMESDLFSRYFAVSLRGNLEGAPVVSVDGRAYPVQELYLEDLKGVFPDLPSVTLEDPGIDQLGYILAARLIKFLDSKEADEQGTDGPGGFAPKRGTVLMFLPGYPEIARMDTTLDEHCESSALWILPLHSQITNEEQSLVFTRPPEKKMRKVILSTNIAESSITVPDIKYVIDFCLVKHLLCDPETNFQSLRIQWASQANATQRKGRAGRVSDGICYRLVTREFYEVCMPDYGLPEMQRCPLEQIVLQVKLLDLGEPRAILGLALQPPREEDIIRTVLLLKQVGAMSTKMRGGVINPYDGDLTFVGRVLGNLPVDVHIGKLLVLGYAFGCLEECLVIGAALSLKSVFARPFKAELEAYRSKMAWADYSFSDCIAVLNVYKEWTRLRRQRLFGRGKGNRQNWREPDDCIGSEYDWCKKAKIQLGRLREVEELTKELSQRLEKLNLRSLTPLHKKPYYKVFFHRPFASEDILILKLVIAGAFYPNYFASGDIDERDAMKMMSGHNPFTTVLVKGVPPYGAQYRSNIARHFRPCGKGKALYFEESRAYVEFEPRGSGAVAPAVYLAIKMRQLRIPMELFISEARNQQIEEKMRDISPFKEGNNRLRSSRTATSLTPNRNAVTEQQTHQVLLPHNGYTEIFITEVMDAGHMWAQLGDQETQAKITRLQGTINQYEGRDMRGIPRRDIVAGMPCLADFAEEFYRARVISTRGLSNGGNQVQVRYLDWGNTGVVDVNQLRQVTQELLQLPFQAFECELCEVKPVYSLQSDDTWSPRADDLVRNITNNKRLVAKVYSQLRGVLRVDLYDTTTEEDIHINQLLINEGFAEFMEEPYASRMAHRQAEGLPDVLEVREDDSGWMETTAQKIAVNEQEAIKVVLSGPFNPYEMNFYCITAIGRLRAARVERDSVNSVVMNDAPQDKHQRFLVAGNVGINQSGTNMIARETTLMPNIHGLLSMVALLFAPCAEFRADPDQHQLTGAIVGLGYDPNTNEPLLHDHDIELTFDVEFNQDDIATINNIRRSINFAVANEGNLAEWGSSSICRIQKAARELILKLVFKRRQDRKPMPFRRPLRWNQVEEENILYPGGDSEADSPLLYVLHNAIAITGQNIEEKPNPDVLRLREKVEQLKQLAGRSSEPFQQEVICELCNVLCRHPRGVSLHLDSRLHKDESRLLFEESYQM